MLRFSSMSRASGATVAVLSLVFAACSGDDENSVSETTEPTADLTQNVEPRPDGFPCPPFAGVYVEESEVYGDNDGDGLSNCQEEQAGSAPGNADTDGDGVSDGIEMGDLLSPLDTDGDGDADYDDADDDGDGCPTADESLEDLDLNGIVQYLDPDEDGCEAVGTGDTSATGDTGTTTTKTTTTKTN